MGLIGFFTFWVDGTNVACGRGDTEISRDNGMSNRGVQL